jgi:hypothetical protein
MATIYFSYNSNDRDLVGRLAAELTTRGHKTIYDVAAPGVWRQQLMKLLGTADVFVPLLTEQSLAPGANFVVSEIGAARALFDLRGSPALVPVIVGNVFSTAVSDLYSLRLPNITDSVVKVATEIIHLWEEHARHSRAEYPRIFISHRHTDVGVAQPLVKLIECVFDVKSTDLRCTSVQPYKLRAGERTSDRLKAELNHGEAVLGIVTPDAKASNYVLFELGASWGRSVVTFPLLARGASAADVPAPIGDLHTLSLTDESDCYQLIEDLSDVVTLPRRAQPGSAIAQLVSELVAAAAEPTLDPQLEGIAATIRRDLSEAWKISSPLFRKIINDQLDFLSRRN